MGVGADGFTGAFSIVLKMSPSLSGCAGTDCCGAATGYDSYCTAPPSCYCCIKGAVGCGMPGWPPACIMDIICICIC